MYFPLTKPHRRDDPVIVLQLYPFLCDLCRENAPASFFLCKADFQNVNDSFLTHLRNVALKDLNLHFTTGIIKSRILPGPVPVKCVTSYFFFYIEYVRENCQSAQNPVTALAIPYISVLWVWQGFTLVYSVTTGKLLLHSAFQSNMRNMSK